MACDMCNKTVPSSELEDLLDRYQTDDVKTVCRFCAKRCNEHLWDLRKVSSRWEGRRMHEFVSGRRVPLSFMDRLRSCLGNFWRGA